MLFQSLLQRCRFSRFRFAYRRITPVVVLASITWILQAADPVPSPLLPADIGKPDPAGSETYTCVSNSVTLPHCRFDVISGGALGNKTDEGRFISQPVPDDVRLGIRVVDAHAQSAGIVLRENSDAGGARFAVVIDKGGRLSVSARAARGAAAKELASASIVFPCELRIERLGDTIEVRYCSGNGVWQKLPEATWGRAHTPVLAGLWAAGGTACLADWDALLKGNRVAFAGNWGESAGTSIDLVKDFSRPFYKIESDDPVSTDPKGWPTNDFRFAFDESLGLPDRSVHNGTFTLVWEGADDAEVSVMGRPANEYSWGEKWHPRPGVSVQTITYTFPKVGVTGWNPNLHSIAFKNTGGTLCNLRMLRPGYEWDTREVFHHPCLALARHCVAIRTMCMTHTNNNLEKTWSDRAHVGDITYAHKGWPWELVVRAANTLHRDLWICVPMMADDNYITKLACLIAFGAKADGEPYDEPTADPVYPPLDPSLNLYVENSNEVWNFGFNQAKQSIDLGKEYLSNPKPTAGYMPKMTETNPAAPWGLGLQMHVKRTIDISNLFRGVFGDQAMISRIRPTLGLQNIKHATIGPAYLPWVEAEYGKPVSYFLHSICVAPYWVPIVGHYAKSLEMRDSATVDEFFAHLLPAAAESYKALPAHMTTAAYYGIKTIAYEGGVFVLDDTRRLQPASLRMLKQAYADRRFSKIISDSQRAWFAGGGDTFSYFTVEPGGLGAFNVTNDLRNQATPVLHGLDAVATSPPPAVEIGFPVDEPGELNASWVNGAKESDSAFEGVNAKHWPGAEKNYLLRCSHDVDVPVRLRLEAGKVNETRTFNVLLDHCPAGEWNIPGDASRLAVDSEPVMLHLTKGFHTLRLVATGETRVSLISLIFGNPRNTKPVILDISPGPWAQNMTAGKPFKTNAIPVFDFETTDPMKLNLTVTSDNPVLFPAGSVQIDRSDKNPGFWGLTFLPPEGQQGSANFTLTATDPDGGVSRVRFQAKVKGEGPLLLTLGKGAGCSAVARPGEMDAGMVIDGNMGTVWESPASDNQYVWVDLGKPCYVDSVRIKFGDNPARDFRILTSKFQPNFYFGLPEIMPVSKGTVTGNTAKEVKIDGIGQTLQYLWLWVDHRVDSKRGAMVAELEAYGSEFTPGLRRIRCGGSTTGGFIDDQDFSGGGVTTNTGFNVDIAGVADPAPAELYASNRSGECQYTMGGFAPGSAQRVRLHFAECQFTSPGKRIFHVEINGQRVISDLDIFAAAPGRAKALVKEVSTAADDKGIVTVKLVKSVDNPQLSGIEVLDAQPVAKAPHLAGPPVIGNFDSSGKVCPLSVPADVPVAATWSVLSAPKDATPPIFPGNGTPGASKTDATFTLSGTWNLACVIADTSGRGERRELQVVVPRMEKGLRVLWPPEAMNDDMEAGMSAMRIDQFGKEIEWAEEVKWSLAPDGIGGKLEIKGRECHYRPPLVAENGSQTIIAEAGGFTARHVMIVTPDCRPCIDTPAAALDPATVGKPIRLSVGASYRLGTDRLTYTWDLVDGPAGAPWPRFDSNNGTASGARTGVVLPSAGKWRLRCVVTDREARDAVSEFVLDAIESPKPGK